MPGRKKALDVQHLRLYRRDGSVVFITIPPDLMEHQERIHDAVAEIAARAENSFLSTNGSDTFLSVEFQNGFSVFRLSPEGDLLTEN